MQPRGSCVALIEGKATECATYMQRQAWRPSFCHGMPMVHMDVNQTCKYTEEVRGRSRLRQARQEIGATSLY